MHYPKEYGGQGRSLMEEVIVMQTLASTCMELRGPGIIMHGMAVLTILHCGNEEQKRKFLPRSSTERYLVPGIQPTERRVRCGQLLTRAVKRMATTSLMDKRSGSALPTCRTTASSWSGRNLNVAKHKGPELPLLDMKLPGVGSGLRPRSGWGRFNELFFYYVCVPVEMLLGGGPGVMIAITTLMSSAYWGMPSWARHIEEHQQNAGNGNSRQSVPEDL